MPTKNTGYSSTPLVKKPGINEQTRMFVKGAPENYRQLLEPLPAGVVFDLRLTQSTDLVHVFVDRKSLLGRELTSLSRKIRRDAVVWISWPKKSSRVPTDITEATIRELALPLGFVDIKVCAVTGIWSGLKLVIRKQLR